PDLTKSFYDSSDAYMLTVRSIFLVLSICKLIFSPFIFFFLNDPATTEIYTLSLHDALPIYSSYAESFADYASTMKNSPRYAAVRSEEHTSELQSLRHLVCRLLLEKKNGAYMALSNFTVTGSNSDDELRHCSFSALHSDTLGC